MSDYLANLAAKALNLTQGIQPRLASLFEPLSAGRAMSASLPADREASPAEPSSSVPAFEAPLPAQESSGNAGQSRPPMRGEWASPMPQQPNGMTDTPAGQPAKPWVTRQPSPLLSPHLVDTTARQLPVQPGATPSQPVAAAAPGESLLVGAARPRDEKTGQPSHPGTSPLMPVTSEQATVARASTPIAQHQSPSTLEQIISRAVDEHIVAFDPPGPKSITHAELVSKQATQASTPVLAVVRPQVTSSREAPSSSPAEGTPTPEPAPTIKITIGRVEVRAILPEAPRPRPTPTRPSPALSLEDYLKQHGRGRR